MTRTLTVADRLIPRDWQRSRVRFPAQVHDGYWVLHRLAGKARLLYFSAVHLKMISQIRIDYLVSLVGHVTPEVAPGQTSSPSMCPSYHACTAACRIAPSASTSPDCIAPIALLTINFRICESGQGNGG